MSAVEKWKDEFGNAYTLRQPEEDLLRSYRDMWGRIAYASFPRDDFPKSVIELGAGVGLNLREMKELWGVETTAVEANRANFERLVLDGHVDNAIQADVAEWKPVKQWDLAFTRGLLIHIPPEKLPAVLDNLYKASSRWIVVAEYYSPRHEAIDYRGEKAMLWRGDFAGMMLHNYPLKLVDYGFVYHLDNDAPQDDVTWFLMEKK